MKVTNKFLLFFYCLFILLGCTQHSNNPNPRLSTISEEYYANGGIKSLTISLHNSNLKKVLFFDSLGNLSSEKTFPDTTNLSQPVLFGNYSSNIIQCYGLEEKGKMNGTIVTLSNNHSRQAVHLFTGGNSKALLDIDIQRGRLRSYILMEKSKSIGSFHWDERDSLNTN